MTQIKKQNLVFVDIETTGLNPDINEIISIGIVVVNQDWKDEKIPSFEVIEELELKIKPLHIENADPIALKVNKYNTLDWEGAYDLKEAMRVFSIKTKDAIMVAHNISFDYMFIEKAFRQTGYVNEMHYHKLDTISIAFAKLANKDDINKFSLRDLSQYFSIENKNAHHALSDAHTTYLLYKKLIEL